VTDASGTSAGSRRGQLLAMKLRALVGDHLGHPLDVTPEGFNGGAALMVGVRSWVLVDDDAERSLGKSLAWARRHEAISLDVIADQATGLLARRAEHFTLPTTVWRAVDRTLLPAVAEPLPDPVSPPPHHLAVRDTVEAAGARLVVEHGVVTGDVRGLEVCRVVDTPTSGYFDEPDGGEPISATAQRIGAHADGSSADSGDVLVEVGVGGPDREAFRIIHGDVPTVEALAGVVATVERHRSAGAPPHPLNRLAPERFLRWRLEREPGLVGFRSIGSHEPPLPRRGLNEVSPCVAVGIDGDGREHALVCSVGVDLDLTPFVADVQRCIELPVVVVLPSRDLLPITVELAGLLAQPVRFVTVD
jgi:hypothetical protein